MAKATRALTNNAPEENLQNSGLSTTASADLKTIQVSGVQIQDPMNVLDSKRYIKGGAVEYKAPIEILSPCIRLLGETGGQIRLTGEAEQSNSNTDGTKNISYGRLNLVTSYAIDDETTYEVGVLIALDISAPKIKIYRGARVSACLNLSIYGADDCVKFDLSNGVNMEVVGDYLRSVTNKIQEAIEIKRHLKALTIPESAINQIIGAMVMQTTSKRTPNGVQSVLTASSLLGTKESKYYYKQPEFNGWLLFNAFTEHFGKGTSFFDVPEKTKETYLMLKDICLS